MLVNSLRYFVGKSLKKYTNYTSSISYISVRWKSIFLQELKERGVLQLSGKDVAPYLQGLITNDINLIGNGKKSLYTLFLNNRGRVKTDAIIHTNSDGIYFIDCDRTALKFLEKHLKIYKLKKDVTISSICEKLSVVVLFDIAEISKLLSEDFIPVFSSENLESSSNSEVISLDDLKLSSVVVSSRDPRIRALGLRMIAPKVLDVKDELKKQNLDVIIPPDNYFKILRYCLGVPEGVEEMPPDQCFPLEMNCDYLNGISFNKGCYIGQELTARTHHTGVVRKRMMPIKLQTPLESSLPVDIFPDSPTVKDKSIGKLRGISGVHGLALLRIKESLQCSFLRVGSNKTGSSIRPKWWPPEVTKTVK